MKDLRRLLSIEITDKRFAKSLRDSGSPRYREVQKFWLRAGEIRLSRRGCGNLSIRKSLNYYAAAPVLGVS
jgi:hypothetical protein